MIFPHTNIKTSGNINLVTRKWKAVRKVAFQALLESYVLRKPKLLNLLLALESTSWNFSETKKNWAFERAQLWQREEMHEIALLNYFSFLELKKVQLEWKKNAIRICLPRSFSFLTSWYERYERFNLRCISSAGSVCCVHGTIIRTGITCKEIPL